MSTDLESALRELELVDHHAHAPLAHAVDDATLQSLITESDHSPAAGTSVFDSHLGVAILRRCPTVLGLDAVAGPDAYLAARRELSVPELTRRLLDASGVGEWLVDTGMGGDLLMSTRTMESVTTGRVREIARLETIAENLVTSTTAAGFMAAFADELSRLSPAVAGWKSVVAYRHGFDFAPTRPSQSEVIVAAGRWMAAVEAGAPARLTDPVLLRMALYAACDTGLPLQLHAGYGDRDLDLHRCNPALLTDWLRQVEPTGTDIMLLHCYPYHREAGYLAQVFPHVYLDVGLAINYTGAASHRIIAESMELAPFTKVLYSSDAYGPPELHYLGALLWRAGTSRVLQSWVDHGGWTLDDALNTARLIGRDNARRVYGGSNE
ncbi:amidohydrolase family protein [Aeromicrobium sp. YIM 150415]|uniref:amidohydrolase family protein n=1 Tax=Aeromicrobium sp. YIM 150415 TaxID=2803912 RepID=UPI00196253FF|nr:amidohydrolase family protein [Aeromicrobium sp. YIM 150415]MBM9463379.1 amidohydrolase family protein [Aeromicrobium sp. YIM 150415]